MRLPAFLITLGISAVAASAQVRLECVALTSGGVATPGLTLSFGQPLIGRASVGVIVLDAGIVPCLVGRGCVADLDDGSGLGHPDGGVTIDDLLYYLGLYEAGDVRGDLDDGTMTGTPDGGVTIDDLLFFLARYEAGC